MPRLKIKRTVATVQAASAFVAGILITFSQAHDAAVGMIALAIVSIAWAGSLGWAAIADKKASGRIFRAVIAVSSAVMAVLAIQAATVSQPDAEQINWAWALLVSWGFAGAIAEVISALFAKPGSIRRRDHLISAGLAAGLGISQFLTPASDPVTHVGFFGAYAVILAVHLGISVLSPTKKGSGKKAGPKKSAAKK